MLATQNTQSLTEFRANAADTLDRLNKTGDAEIITVNGQAKAVLLSPAVYDELAREIDLSRDIETMRRAFQDYKEGKSMEVDEAFADIRAKLKSMKASKQKAEAK